MARTWFVLMLVALVGPPVAAQDRPPELVASTDPRNPEQERAGFRLPEGFTIQLVAAEPEIHKPMNIAFDDRGRLWVTETIEYPFPAPADRTPRDGLKVLEDFDANGRARKITTFADGLNIPIGLLPMPGGRAALVHSIPHILRLEDTDNDGKADRREPVYATFGARDTHGMTNGFSWGPDGWVYATHGFSNESTVKGADDRPITMQSGNTYRMRADGSHLEFFTHGQVNPFGLCFDSLGNVYSADCHTRPMYQLLRGAWYPSFGKPHDGLGFGPEMVQHDHGSTAIAGIVHYSANAFPAPYRDALYVGNVVTNRINFDRLERHGSTLKGIAQPDFLVCEDPWFRPVDLKLGPDGALYVADFYNRIIGHYEVPLDHPGRDRERGRIWRITAGPTDRAPDVSDSATIDGLIAALDHPNLVVRTFAANQLSHRPGAAQAVVAKLRDGATPLQWAHGIWVAQRLEAPETAELVATAARHAEALVRIHAQRVLAERASWTEADRQVVREALSDPDAFVQRAAAEALGRHPRPDQLGPLLAIRLAVPSDDTHLLHVVRMALRDHFLDENVWMASAKDPRTEAENAVLADVMTGVPLPQAAAFLVARLVPGQGDVNQRADFTRHIARHGAPETIKALVTALAADDASGLSLVKAALEGTRARGAAPEPALRSLALERARAALNAKDGTVLVQALEQVRDFGLVELGPDVTALANRGEIPQNVRLAAFEALNLLDPKKAVAALSAVLADASQAVPLREQVALVLARLNRPEAREALLAALPIATARLQASIAAGLAQSSEGAKALLDTIAAGKASARLLTERNVEVKLKQAGFDERLDKLTAGLPQAEERIQVRIDERRAAFEKARATANADLGVGVFSKQCAACHMLGGQGGKVGPQLDGVGLRGADRLIEDLLDPNRNVDQAFRSTTLALTDGQVLSGLLLREEGQVLVIADAQGKEVRVEKSKVEESRAGQVSPMPANLIDLIGEDDFQHLLAYLLRQVPKDEPR